LIPRGQHEMPLRSVETGTRACPRSPALSRAQLRAQFVGQTPPAMIDRESRVPFELEAVAPDGNLRLPKELTLNLGYKKLPF